MGWKYVRESGEWRHKPGQVAFELFRRADTHQPYEGRDNATLAQHLKGARQGWREKTGREKIYWR